MWMLLLYYSSELHFQGYKHGRNGTETLQGILFPPALQRLYTNNLRWTLLHPGLEAPREKEI